jgi:AP-4 complex subunit sigma-1
MIEYILLVNKQGQARVSKYFDTHRPPKERVLFETEIVRKCLLRADDQVLPPAWPCKIINNK